MALYKKKIAQEQMNSLTHFSERFFELYHYFLANHEEFIIPRVHKSGQFLNRIIIWNNEKKQEICANAKNLTEKDCKALLTMVKAEEHARQLKQLMTPEKEDLKGKPYGGESDYFYHLLHFLQLSENQWMEHSEITEEISGYFLELAKDLKRNQEIYGAKILSIWRHGETWNSERKLDYTDKLHLLHNLKLMEKMARAFEFNSLNIQSMSIEFHLDPELQYFTLEFN